MPKSEANRIECAVHIYHNSIDLLLKAQANQIMHIHGRTPTYTIYQIPGVQIPCSAPGTWDLWQLYVSSPISRSSSC